MNPPVPETDLRVRTTSALVVGTLLCLLGVVPGWVLVGSAGLLSDGGVDDWVYALFSIWAAFLGLLFVAPTAAWIAWAFRRNRLALVLITTPVACAIAGVIVCFASPYA